MARNSTGRQQEAQWKLMLQDSPVCTAVYSYSRESAAYGKCTAYFYTAFQLIPAGLLDPHPYYMTLVWAAAPDGKLQST